VILLPLVRCRRFLVELALRLFSAVVSGTFLQLRVVILTLPPLRRICLLSAYGSGALVVPVVFMAWSRALAVPLDLSRYRLKKIGGEKKCMDRYGGQGWQNSQYVQYLFTRCLLESLAPQPSPPRILATSLPPTLSSSLILPPTHPLHPPAPFHYVYPPDAIPPRRKRRIGSAVWRRGSFRNQGH
jgi:hypothetical protein